MAAGYLISITDGRPLEVFGLCAIPATLVVGLPDQVDLGGDIHPALAIAVIGLSWVHALGALKYHFIDRDKTLLRMLGRGGQTSKTCATVEPEEHAKEIAFP